MLHDFRDGGLVQIKFNILVQREAVHVEFGMNPTIK